MRAQRGNSRITKAMPRDTYNARRRKGMRRGSLSERDRLENAFAYGTKRGSSSA